MEIKEQEKLIEKRERLETNHKFFFYLSLFGLLVMILYLIFNFSIKVFWTGLIVGLVSAVISLISNYSWKRVDEKIKSQQVFEEEND